MVDSWLHSNYVITRSISCFWRNISKSKHLITKWLSWLPVSGHSISLGRDRILGLDDLVTLSPRLIAHLHTKDIWYLYQMCDVTRPAYLPDCWINSTALGLDDEISSEWHIFCTKLSQSGIHLIYSVDTLQWPGETARAYSLYKMFTQQL